ncbi:hypothetical protein [Helicobacter aurati]|nr:hypothetical protein [Helicobacter aurati]
MGKNFVRASRYHSRIEQALAQSARILPTLANMTRMVVTSQGNLT